MAMRVITGLYQRPFAEYKHLKFDFQIIIQTAKKGLRPTLPETCPEKWRELMTRCWSHEPDARPEFEEVIDLLAELKANPELSKSTTTETP